MRNSREVRKKSEFDTAERERAWAKDKEKAEIARITDKSRKKSEADMRARKKANSARRVAE